MLKRKRTSGVVGFFADDHALLNGAQKTYDAGFRKFEAISPFPVHGMDDAMGLKRSWVPWVTFFAGLTGLCFALWFQSYVAVFDWPLNIGGKPMFSWPAFIPIVFELTVLFGALLTVGAVILACRLPDIDPPVIDLRLTDDRFALFVPQDDSGFESGKVEAHLKQAGATEVRRVAEY